MAGITQTAIARKLNISRSAVAAVLCNSPHSRIAPATRDLILQTAAEMGYVPNRHAQIMSTGKSGAIAVITFGNTGIGLQKIQIAVDAITEAGFEAIEHNVYWYADSGEKACRRMLELRVEGVLLVHPGLYFTQKHLDILLNAGIPVVALGSSELQGIIRYMSDKDQGFHTLTQYLLSLGYRRPTLLLGESSQEAHQETPLPVWHRVKATAGFNRALAECPDAKGRIHITQYDIYRSRGASFCDPYKPGYDGMKEALADGDLPDVVLCSNDTWAHGALAACSELDLRVPHDMAVVGFENESSSQYGPIPLTTMAHPTAEMAQDGTRLLIAQIRREHPPEDRLIVLPCQLVIRRSCGGYLKKQTATADPAPPKALTFPATPDKVLL